MSKASVMGTCTYVMPIVRCEGFRSNVNHNTDAPGSIIVYEASITTPRQEI